MFGSVDGGFIVRYWALMQQRRVLKKLLSSHSL